MYAIYQFLVAPHLNRGRIILSLALFGLCSACGPGPPPPDYFADPHVDLLVASTGKGGGALAVDFDFDATVPVYFSECFGGTGSDCTGGVAVYSSEAPGFGALETDEPDEGFYALGLGVTVRFEVVAVDPGMSLFIDGVLLDQPGESVALPPTPNLHTHGAWQVAVDDPDDRLRTFTLSFLMTTTAAGYAESEVYTLLFRPTAGSAPEE